MTEQFSIWTPKFDGDAPPNWDGETMKVDYFDGEPICRKSYQWFWSAGVKHWVSPEALATPFDYPTWAAQGRANADKLPTGVAEALGPERDWADDVWDEAYETWRTITTPDDADKKAAAAVIRAMCRPIGNDTVTDEWLKTGMARVQDYLDNGMVKSAADCLRDIIDEATQ